MAKLPRPPADLAGVPPEWRAVPSGTALFRVYFRASRHPTTWNTFRFFGPVNARFDHHEEPPRAQDRGILYPATHPRAALAEAFQAGRLIDARTDEPWLVGFRLTETVRLLDLLGLWPTRAGRRQRSTAARARPSGAGRV